MTDRNRLTPEEMGLLFQVTPEEVLKTATDVYLNKFMEGRCTVSRFLNIANCKTLEELQDELVRGNEL